MDRRPLVDLERGSVDILPWPLQKYLAESREAIPELERRVLESLCRRGVTCDFGELRSKVGTRTALRCQSWLSTHPCTNQRFITPMALAMMAGCAPILSDPMDDYIDAACNLPEFETAIVSYREAIRHLLVARQQPEQIYVLSLHLIRFVIDNLQPKWEVYQ